ncbi:molybdopterin cofactor-binding domain-containing protein [Saccharopolyspora sp. ID03-671]|uniref:xanthine dehydrogenase family protein molybdopterin-binding subunit n=1 Tax=Saccharopolyspora sp. ID03-671 TaxID=3073066 RepID=UPI00324DF0B0
MESPATAADNEEKPGLRRRRFLTYLAAAPTLTVVGKVLAEGEAAAATAAPGQLPVPPIADLFDMGDAINLLATPTFGELRLGISENNEIWFELPKTEVGQGINTTVAMILAEEFDAKPDDIAITHSDARPELSYSQVTAFSTSVRVLRKPLASMAAAGRTRLVTAASKRWNIPANRLSTKDTCVYAPDGRKLTFGELSKDAAKVAIPAVPAKPKPPERYHIVGKPLNRLDSRDIVTGKASYISDTKIPGSVVAVVVRPPTIGGTVASFDDSAARRMPGVVAITQIPTGIAVCAENTWQAMEAAKKVEVTWESGASASRSGADIAQVLKEKAGSLGDVVSPDGGEFDERFDFAFTSHAPMETGFAVADVQDGRAEVWCSSHVPIEVQKAVANELGLTTADVTVHVKRAGGSFGRNCHMDAPIEAAQVSKATGKVVKLFWTRNDDTRHGRMRAATHQRVQASVRAGKVRSFHHRVSGAWTDLTHGLGDIVFTALMELGKPAKEAVADVVIGVTQTVPYEFGLATVSGTETDVDLPNTGVMRGVHSVAYRVAEEITVDQIAKHLGEDPVDFRLEALKDDRTKAVLRKVAQEGDWGRSMPKGHAQGIGIHQEYKSMTATLVEIDATDPEEPRVTKAFVAIDPGRAINPRGVEAQMQGGLMDGINTVLYAGLHIDGGAVREGSFADFRVARQAQAPLETKVFIMPPTGEPGGVGEISVPASAAAVANAYGRATGTVPRQFPINNR